MESHVDLENNTVWAEISRFSLYTVMVNTQPADISISRLTITPEEIYEGEAATVDVVVVNSGASAGSYEVTLKIDGIVKETSVVDVAGNDSITISFDLIGLDSGTYEIAIGDAIGTLTVVKVIEPTKLTPAMFTVSSLGISPVKVNIGDDVNITVRVDNTGEMEGEYQVVCKVNGVVVDEKEITLAGGKEESVTFILTMEEAGGKTIEINELTGSLVVEEGEEEPDQEGAIAEIPTQETPEEPVSTSSNWWIIGLVLVVCILLITGYIYIIKKKKTQNINQH